jgi:alkanesulfonate monooxygenase SsuD/methylene tetrahydromethanopterin reductase-like flavin-dependent oxidoreductase (luciferase family)
LPFVVAADGPRMLRLAARVGQGWATTGSRRGEGEGAWWAAVAELADRFSEVLDAAGRAPDAVDRMLSIDAGPRFALASAELFSDYVGRARELGFTDVVAHWPVPGAPVYDAPETMVETIAELLPGLR